ncbi:double-stranded RNA-specific adenosine deaminase-like isoform X2 [Ptychodera flava]|uniref:double-stranded RNA-specific adenosine deaminase-like isoform X2 n=1 Tax=Ptychodera flava TaxID=63121 RepID=UPI00396A8AD0
MCSTKCSESTKGFRKVDIEERILGALQNHNTSLSVSELLKDTGIKQKKEINQILYKLRKKGVIVKVSDVPPKWGLKHPVFVDRCVSDEEETSGDDAHVTQDNEIEGECNNDDDDGDDDDDHNDENLPVVKEEPDENYASAGDHGNTMYYQESSPQIPLDLVAMETNHERLGFQSSVTDGDSNHVGLMPNQIDMATPNAEVVIINNNKETLKVQLLSALSKQSEPIHANNLAKLVGLNSKKDINPILFPMQNMGLVSKVSNVPPKWVITDKGADNVKEQDLQMSQESAFVVPPDPRQVIHQIGANVFTQPVATSQVNRSELEKSLLQALASKESYKAMDLARAVGFQSKKDINPTLFHLQRKGLTKKINDSPPTWCITSKGKEQIEGEDVQMGPCPTEDEETAFKIPPTPMDTMQTTAGDMNGQQNTMDGSAGVTALLQQTALTGGGNGGAFGSMLTSEAFAVINKNPISALMEYAQSRQFKCSIDVLYQSGPPHSPRFTMAASVNGRRFPSVISKSKKDGKREAADKALRVLIAEGSIKPQVQAASIPNNNKIFTNESLHADKIAALSHQTFNAVVANIPECISGRKILAALVMFRDCEDQGTVISLGTGNRCVTGDMLSLEGNTVNDSHAEIITRRSFLRYLYQQLNVYLDNPGESIFESKPCGKLGVQQGITFHLYISTAPCGDGAQFSRGDSSGETLTGVGSDDFTGNATHQPTFTKSIQGLLRTKMEGGEGTIPIDRDSSVQTWDGIIRGERLRTMSCSDKIARWNLLGLQGALLTHFIKPIYLASITLGSLYHHGHLSRALCCRLSHGNQDKDYSVSLPPTYQLHHPQLGCVTAFDPPRETEKTKALSINWCVNDPKPEVTDGTKGKCLERSGQSNVSVVAKAPLYAEFQNICKRLNREDLLQANTYHRAKKMAKEYQQAKSYMMEYFEKNDFGKWMEKPPEEEMFSV